MSYNPLLRFWPPNTRHDQRTEARALCDVTRFAMAAFWLRRVGGCSNGDIRVDRRELVGDPLMQWVGVWFDADTALPWYVGQVVEVEPQDDSVLLRLDGAWTRYMKELRFLADYGPEADPETGDVNIATLQAALAALWTRYVRGQNHPYLRFTSSDAAALVLPPRSIERLAFNMQGGDDAARDIAAMANQCAIGADVDGRCYAVPNGHDGVITLAQQSDGDTTATRAQVMARPRAWRTAREMCNDLTIRGGALAPGRPFTSVYLHPWSIIRWGRRGRTESVPSVRTRLDGLNYAYGYFQRYANPGVAVELVKVDYTAQRIMPGRLACRVRDHQGLYLNDTDNRDTHWIEGANYSLRDGGYEITLMIGRAKDNAEATRQARAAMFNDMLLEREPTGRAPSQDGRLDYLDSNDDGIPDAFEGPQPWTGDSIGDTGLAIPPYTVPGQGGDDYPFLPDPLPGFIDPGNPLDNEFYGAPVEGLPGTDTGADARLTLNTPIYDGELRATLGDLLALVADSPGDPESTAATLVLGDFSNVELDGEKIPIDWIIVGGRAQTRLANLGTGLHVVGSGDSADIRLHYGHGFRALENGSVEVAPYFEA